MGEATVYAVQKGIKMKNHHSTDYTGCGIYCLFNIREKKAYIGKSSNIRRRFEGHVRSFRAKNKSNPMYQKNINDFAFFVICELSEEMYELLGDVLEMVYMDTAMGQKIKLYNIVNAKSCRDNITFHLENKFATDKKFRESFHASVGKTPSVINLCTKETLGYLAEKLNA